MKKSELIEELERLSEGEKFKFTYNYQHFNISVYTYASSKRIYSVDKDRSGIIGQAMNVEKITNKAIHLYLFNIVGRKYVEKIELEKITPGHND